MPVPRTADSVADAALVYRFASFELDPNRYELRERGRVLEISSKSFEVLLYLVRSSARSVSRKELLDALWPGVRVAGGSLTQAIWNIRSVLRTAGASPPIIKTIRGVGYRFVAPVSTARTASTQGVAEAPRSQVLRERLCKLPAATRSLVLQLAAELAQDDSNRAGPCRSCQHRPLQ
jgi:DNA-binding winged helix-turn-helix (wHTH) protein